MPSICCAYVVFLLLKPISCSMHHLLNDNILLQTSILSVICNVCVNQRHAGLCKLLSYILRPGSFCLLSCTILSMLSSTLERTPLLHQPVSHFRERGIERRGARR
uniref:Putative secreted peptide n=1 Tax=Anopheles braziliensis TaxID=58242 RepID=A0A2M3ZUM3_9DIPT